MNQQNTVWQSLVHAVQVSFSFCFLITLLTVGMSVVAGATVLRKIFPGFPELA